LTLSATTGFRLMEINDRVSFYQSSFKVETLMLQRFWFLFLLFMSYTVFFRRQLLADLVSISEAIVETEHRLSRFSSLGEDYVEIAKEYHQCVLEREQLRQDIFQLKSVN
jgi:hypothetical protein